MRKFKPACCDNTDVKPTPAPKGNGYPVEIENKKTVTVRGTGAATKGTKASSKWAK